MEPNPSDVLQDQVIASPWSVTRLFAEGAVSFWYRLETTLQPFSHIFFMVFAHWWRSRSRFEYRIGPRHHCHLLLMNSSPIKGIFADPLLLTQLPSSSRNSWNSSEAAWYGVTGMWIWFDRPARCLRVSMRVESRQICLFLS
jgi:hypothetical protein